MRKHSILGITFYIRVHPFRLRCVQITDFKTPDENITEFHHTCRPRIGDIARLAAGGISAVAGGSIDQQSAGRTVKAAR